MDVSEKLRTAIQNERELSELSERENADFREDWTRQTQEIKSILQEAAAAIEPDEFFLDAQAVEEKDVVALLVTAEVMGRAVKFTICFSADANRTILCTTKPPFFSVDERFTLEKLTEGAVQDKVVEFVLTVYRWWQVEMKRRPAWILTRSLDHSPSLYPRASQGAEN